MCGVSGHLDLKFGLNFDINGLLKHQTVVSPARAAVNNGIRTRLLFSENRHRLDFVLT